MKIAQLRIYALVVKYKGFTTAAPYLNISPTAVSKQIKNLEDYLNVQLIERTTTKFKITEIGEIFYKQCIQILNDIDNIKNITQSFHERPSGKLKLFASAAFAETFIIPHLNEFIVKYPKIDLELDFNDRIPDIHEENIDLCLGLNAHWDQTIIQKKLLTTIPYILASPAYLQQYGEPNTIESLTNHRFICHSNRPDLNTIKFKEEIFSKVNCYISVNNYHSMLQCALHGLGIVYLYDVFAKFYLNTGKLKQVLPHKDIFSKNYYAFYTKRNHVKPSSRIFLNYILKKITSDTNTHLGKTLNINNS